MKLLVFLVLLAAVVYVLVRAAQQRGIRPQRRPAAPPPRPHGPDDDPDFLRDLDRKRRQADGDAGGSGGTGSGT